jgi:hypothetical protein
MHSYRFADPGHEVVERDDGRCVPWPKGVNPGNISVPGFQRLVEEFLGDNAFRRIEPYRFKVEGRALTVLTAALGEDAAAEAIEALQEARLMIVDLPTPCR